MKITFVFNYGNGNLKPFNQSMEKNLVKKCFLLYFAALKNDILGFLDIL